MISQWGLIHEGDMWNCSRRGTMELNSYYTVQICSLNNFSISFHPPPKRLSYLRHLLHVLPTLYYVILIEFNFLLSFISYNQSQLIGVKNMLLLSITYLSSFSRIFLTIVNKWSLMQWKATCDSLAFIH